MTEPLSMYYRGRVIARKYLRKIPNNYGGHYSVTRSLFDGFKEVGFQDYNYRPSLRSIHKHVHVLSGIPALKYAIKLKEKGVIDKITAGPNIIGFPDSKGWEYLLDKNVELVLFPSMNTTDFFCKYIPELRNKVRVFASGINANEFKPKPMKRQYVLLYLKCVSSYWGDYISYILRKHGFVPYVIQYGSYTLDEYKGLLNKSLFMISISKHDTQGLYLAEAWAMDCPTVCYNSCFSSFPTTKTINEGSQLGSPYVCGKNGVVFNSIEQLEYILIQYKTGNILWRPRKWVLENMTDAICSQKFLDLVLER